MAAIRQNTVLGFPLPPIGVLPMKRSMPQPLPIISADKGGGFQPVPPMMPPVSAPPATRPTAPDISRFQAINYQQSNASDGQGSGRKMMPDDNKVSGWGRGLAAASKIFGNLLASQQQEQQQPARPQYLPSEIPPPEYHFVDPYAASRQRRQSRLQAQPMATGGKMMPGMMYRVGAENIQMNPDGTADVLPSLNPEAHAYQQAAEQADGGDVGEPMADGGRMSAGLLDAINRYKNFAPPTEQPAVPVVPAAPLPVIAPPITEAQPPVVDQGSGRSMLPTIEMGGLSTGAVEEPMDTALPSIPNYNALSLRTKAYENTVSPAFKDNLKIKDPLTGKTIKDNWTKWDRIGQFLKGFAEGGIVEGIRQGTDRHYNEKQRQAEARGKAWENLQAQQKIDDFNTNQQNIKGDNARLDQQAKDTAAWHKDETLRKTNDSASRERTSRMNAVAGMFKNIPAYDPNDPKFAELTQALGDAQLPLTPKDAKKKIDLKQDQRTGAWTTILTDPLTGKQESRDVIKDGKPYISTPTVVMQGEYGLFKQNDQQNFQAGENDKSRQFQAGLAGAKAQFQLAKTQFGEAQAQKKVIESFKRLYFQKNNKPPTNEDIAAYLGALSAPDEEQ